MVGSTVRKDYFLIVIWFKKNQIHKHKTEIAYTVSHGISKGKHMQCVHSLQL